MVGIVGAQVDNFECQSLHLVLMQNVNKAFSMANRCSFNLDPAPLVSDTVLKLMTTNLQSISYHEVIAAIQLLGNIFLNNDDMAINLLKLDILEQLMRFLKQDNDKIINEALWSVSNLTSGRPETITFLVNHDLFAQVLVILLSNQHLMTTRMEAAIIVTNSCIHGEETIIRQLVRSTLEICDGLVTGLKLFHNNTDTLVRLLQAIHRLLKIDQVTDKFDSPSLMVFNRFEGQNLEEILYEV